MQKESSNMTNYPMLLAAQQQLYDYAVRLRLSVSAFTDPRPLYAVSLGPEPKPSHSYIGLIAMAILSSPQQQLVLSDIYQWILDRYPYFRARGSGWRNSIRHNLSLNDCFVKAGRSANGKGHYWSIHPANLADFLSGDFRRRRAQRRVRKSMGLPVPVDEDEDDDDEDEQHFEHSLTKFSTKKLHSDVNNPLLSSSMDSANVLNHFPYAYFTDRQSTTTACSPVLPAVPPHDQARASGRKRCFDVDSLLAPDRPRPIKRQRFYFQRNEGVHSPFSKSDRSTDTETST